VGCGSHWFCPKCRQRTAARIRREFERKPLGLVTAATRAGLTRRDQQRGNRFGERLLTLTGPHIGTTRERIQMLHATWRRFWRLLTDELRPQLLGPGGISIDDVPNGFPRAVLDPDSNELAMYDLLSYFRVFEWTPGADGKGHPHLHVWLFSRFIERDHIKAMWEAAYHDVERKRSTIIGPTERRSLVVDIRKAGGDVSHELVKYLTKDWEVTTDGAKRASPAAFAQLHTEMDGKRMRQSSAAFAMWAVAKLNVCPCCGFERERGHWARVDVTHWLENAEPLGPASAPPETIGKPVTPASGEQLLRRAWEAKRDAEWLDSFELRILRARLGFALERPLLRDFKPPVDEPAQLHLFGLLHSLW